MRAAHEAKKAGLPVTNLLDDHGQKVMHRHGKSNYAVYTLTPQAQRSSTFQELQEAKKRTEPVSRADGPEEQQPAQLSLLTSHQ